ncbi:Crp/Fnr family transcriptional regulator [Petroclostridium sp. X23]|uniref:Crp/Fnr family transcriptional regulator n=1 Tax=Petroclostridium sp. X23 TaxID=3045146 RepID=UPI0024ACFCA3|nr:Crp/Fnr family transcriptional regulator [Petroclostridium sp. X23]WHH58084.1 Crp/Fnr family transcriptional regulator [Petroclostridium sp. X23]
MNNIIEALKHCFLFRNFSDEEIYQALTNIDYKIKSYAKDEVIAIEDDRCVNLGVVIEGSIEIQKIFASGKTLTITRLGKGQIFGEVIIFSDTNQYPATIASCESSKVMFISKEEILKFCSLNIRFLNNFIGSLSDKILLLNKKLKSLSYHTIRQKVASYLLEEYGTQNKSFITLTLSKKQLAEQLGIPRPSLSRELINLRDEGIIDFDRNIVKIIDVNVLEECLYE